MEQQRLNPVIVYILAVLGFLCCCIGGVGFVFAAIAFFIAKSKLKAANEDIETYDTDSIKAMNTAKIVALVILIINLVFLLWTIYRIYTIGWDELIDTFKEAMEQARQNQ